MVKFLSISGKNSLVDPESIPKSTLQLLFLCSIVSNAVFARKDDKSYESKNHPSPTYRFGEDTETGFDNDNRNPKENSDRLETNWNGMKGVYGYRNSDAFRMLDYLGRNYAFNGKSTEPGASSSNPTDVVIRGKDNSQETKGHANSKIQIKNLIQNHRLEQEVVEQKPERLTQMSGDEAVDEEEENDATEIPATTTTSTTTTMAPTESTTKLLTTLTTSKTTTSTTPTPTTLSSTVPSTFNNNQQREVEGRPSTPLSMTNPTLSSPPPSPSPESLSAESLKQHKKNLHHKLSVHQLISESMPTLQMSVSPIYFYNRQTRSLVAIPYLIMKSTSKMPLLPGMMDSGTTGGSPNLINYMNSPFSQKLRSRSINNLSPLLEGYEPRSSIDEKLSDLTYPTQHDEPEASASSRWMIVPGSNSNQNSNHGLGNW